MTHQPIAPPVAGAAPTPGPRRSGGLTPAPLAGGLAARLVELHGPEGAVRAAYALGQSRGHGRLGSLLGCQACRARAVATVAGWRGCLDCGVVSP